MDKPRSERPMEFDDQVLDALLHVSSRQRTPELTIQPNSSYMTVNCHHVLRKVNKYQDSESRQLFTNNLAQRASIYRSLLSRQNHNSFFERIVTGDER